MIVSNMNQKRVNKILFVALLTFFVAGVTSSLIYKSSPSNAIDKVGFQVVLNRKMAQADALVKQMKYVVTHTSVDSLIRFVHPDNNLSFYVIQRGQLIFWTDNQLDISGLDDKHDSPWTFVQIPNAFCVTRVYHFDDLVFRSVIKIKNNYPYENQELTNGYAQGFQMNREVRMTVGRPSDKLAVFANGRHYLFSFQEPKTPVYNELWATTGLIFFSLFFAVFFLLYARFPFLWGRKKISLKQFAMLALTTGLGTAVCLYFNVPGVLFLNKLFTPFQYASNPFLNSIMHLSVATFYVFSTVHLYRFHVRHAYYSHTSGLKFVRQLVYPLYFIVLFYILSGLVYHSSVQFNILHFNDFSFISIWSHFLLFVWGIGLMELFFATHVRPQKNALKAQMIFFDLLSIGLVVLIYRFSDTAQVALNAGIWFGILCFLLYLPFFFRPTRKQHFFIALWSFAYAFFIILNTYIISENNKFDKYKILAQNISINGNTENDRMAEILLEELDGQIKNDKKIVHLLAKADSLQVANAYINTRYLRGFWNKYDMRLNVAGNRSDLFNEYSQFVSGEGKRIKNTHFFSVPANDNNMSYIGVFGIKPPSSDSLTFYMEFYPRKNFKSYSFPNLLISSAPDIQTQQNISIAKYEHNRLVYSSGSIDYMANSQWIPSRKADFFQWITGNHLHYIYNPGNSTYIVITEQQAYRPMAYVLYFVYTFLAFFSLSLLLQWMSGLLRNKKNYRIGFTARFQYAFILLLIVSFLGIFYVSVNFIQKKYRDEQVANLENKKEYIQKALQDMYYWHQDLSANNTQNLNFDLQDLSYIYHTDIHVYNNYGQLVGSSQPVIFNKDLISRRLSPYPFFTQNANINRYEQIGNLKYLTGYTDFYNGDYLQIGYIAVPQFFSQDEIKTEIEGFLAVIIHIYLIIIVLAILLSVFIGKQLSAPLQLIENKLKEMRLGQRNDRIDYSANDEIGQLVVQYNRMVDELEQSARLLAKSERESAWKSMARQVAHEINNPLTPMKLTIQQLQRTKDTGRDDFDQYFKKSTAMLIEQIDNLSRIAGTFSNFARMPEAKFTRFDINEKLHSVTGLFANNSDDNVEVVFRSAGQPVYVMADPEQMVQVFNNLLKNALQSIPEHKNGRIEVKVILREKEVDIVVEDNGSGIPDDIQEKLFVPNFTTKSTGMGLGLAISKNIIEITGGTISFVTKVGGTAFTVVLPLAD